MSLVCKYSWPSLPLKVAQLSTQSMPAHGYAMMLKRVQSGPTTITIPAIQLASRLSLGGPISGWRRLSLVRDSWSAPVSVQRLEPNDNMQEVAAHQIRALLTLRANHKDIPIFVFDAGYDPVQLAQLLNDQPLALLVRLRSNRCFLC